MVDRKDTKEPEADGVHTLIRPRLHLRSRREALEHMAAIVRASPPVTRPTASLRWVAEKRGKDTYQTPWETEQAGEGDCEDIEMHAARADLDAGARGVRLCMTVHTRGPRTNEHVFGMRGDKVVDRSVMAGMPPIPAHRYERRVCALVSGEDPMAVQDISTGGPASEVMREQDWGVHGIAHWRAKAWDRAANQMGQRFPQSRAMYARVVPALKSAASYLSSLHIAAWDAAGNDARRQKIRDAVWQSKKAENMLRARYLEEGGSQADFVIDFERRYGRPPTDRVAVTAALRAMTFLSTARENHEFRTKIKHYMDREPRTLTQAALQISVIAQGYMPADAFPVSPGCLDCQRRKHGQQGRPWRRPRPIEPDDITVNVVYAPTQEQHQTNNQSTTVNTATAPATQAVDSPFAAAPLAAPAPPPPAALPSPTPPPPAVGFPPAPMGGMPFAGGLPMGGNPFMGGAPFAGGNPFMGGTPFAGGNPFMGGTPFASASPLTGTAAGGAGSSNANEVQLGQGNTVSDSGNVTMVFNDPSAFEDGSAEAVEDPNAVAAADPQLAQMDEFGLMTGGGDLFGGGGDEELFSGGGDGEDDDEDQDEDVSSGGDDGMFVVSGGDEDDGFFVASGGDEDDGTTMVTGGGDDDGTYVVTGGDDDGMLVVSGGDDDGASTSGDDGLFVASGGGDDLFGDEDDDIEGGLFFGGDDDESDCPDGTCGLDY